MYSSLREISPIKSFLILRSNKESLPDGVTLSNDDAQRFLSAMKEFMQITSDEQDQQTADGSRYEF